MGPLAPLVASLAQLLYPVGRRMATGAPQLSERGDMAASDASDNPVRPPAFGEETEPHHASADTIALLTRRRSTAADQLGGPGPSDEVLQNILTIAARAPDHRRVTPFRFIVVDGEGRRKVGDLLAKAFMASEPDATPERVEKERARFLRTPVVVAVVSSVNLAHKTPEWEQILTAGAVCQNMLIAASAHGYAAQWLSEWYAYDQAVLAGFGLEPHERIAGFIYIGAAKTPPKERARPEMSSIISRFEGVDRGD